MPFIRSELRRFIRRPSFFFTIAIFLYALLYEHLSYIGIPSTWYQDSVYHMFMISMDFGMMKIVFAFCAVLPAALSVIEDRKSGFLRLMLYRAGSKKRYVLLKATSTSLCAALAALAAFGSYLLFLLLTHPLVTPEDAYLWQLASEHSYARFIQTAYGLPYIAENVLRVLISACLWNLIAVFICTLWYERTVTLSLVFLLFYGLDTILPFFGLPDWRPWTLLYSWYAYDGSILWRYAQNILLIMGAVGGICLVEKCRFKISGL